MARNFQRVAAQRGVTLTDAVQKVKVFRLRELLRQPVRILNAELGRNPYTSQTRARDLVQRGLATWSARGITMLVVVIQRQETANRQDAAIDAAIKLNHGGLARWNGCDRRENAMHRPGEGPLFQRPDAILY